MDLGAGPPTTKVPAGGLRKKGIAMQASEAESKATSFAIFGTQRTGTTLIRTSLSSHPDILCQGEVFNLGKQPYRDEGGYWHYSRQNLGRRVSSMINRTRSTEAYLDQLYDGAGYAAIGFKLMLNQTNRRPYILPLLLRRGIKVILVERRNVLKTLVSRRTASSSGVYHVSQSFRRGSSVTSWTPEKIPLAIDTLISDLDAISAERSRWESKLETLERLLIVYEEYTADIQSGNKSMLDFLGVRHVPISSDLQKVNPDRLDTFFRSSTP